MHSAYFSVAGSSMQKTHVQTQYIETAGNNLIRFHITVSLHPLSVPAYEYDKLREMSFYIFGISVPSESQRYCSSISHHFIQFHAAERDNADIIRFFFFSALSMNSQGAKASIVRTPV